MSQAVRWLTTARVRRVVQVLLLAVFFTLILLTRFQAASPVASPDGKTDSPPALQAPAPLLKIFFLIDPLITAVTALTAHSVPKIALWSLLDNWRDDPIRPSFLRLDLPDGNDPRHQQPVIPPPKKPQGPGQLVAMATGQVLYSGWTAGRGDFRLALGLRVGSHCLAHADHEHRPCARRPMGRKNWFHGPLPERSGNRTGADRQSRRTGLSIHKQIRIRAGRIGSRPGLYRRRLDPSAFCNYGGPKRLAAAILVPISLPAGRIFGDFLMAAPVAAQGQVAILQPVRPLRHVVPRGGSRWAGRGLETHGMPGMHGLQ